MEIIRQTGSQSTLVRVKHHNPEYENTFWVIFCQKDLNTGLKIYLIITPGLLTNGILIRFISTMLSGKKINFLS